jgi:predicted nucleic acid-binding protein
VSVITALLDASVLYRATARSILLYLAVADVYRARWSEAIQDEWIAALLRNDASINPVRIGRTRALMEHHIPDASVSGYEPLIATLTLPDANDRHVLAAAIHGEAQVIVTENLRHFPEAALAPQNIRAETADQFMCALLENAPDAVLAAFAADRAGLRNPPLDTDGYLAALVASKLPETAIALQAFKDRL